MADMRQLLGNIYDSVKNSPVEIRNSEATLMRRGTISTMASGEVFSHDQKIGGDLPLGNYTAKIVLPAGGHIVQPIVIGEGGTADLSEVATRILQANKDRTETEPFDAALTAAASIRGTVASSDARFQNVMQEGQHQFRLDASVLEGMGAGIGDMKKAHSSVYLRFFEGVFDKTRQIDPAPRLADGSNFPGLSIEPGKATIRNSGNAGLTLQLLQASQSTLNIVIPPRCTVTVLRPSNAPRPGLEMKFGIAIVDELIALRTQGLLSEAVGVAKTMNVADVLEIAATHPIAAIAAAYILLRLGDFSIASASIKALEANLPPGPDLLIISAELNARNGNHDDAKQGFLDAWHLGLPVLCSGLAYLIDRLRFYEQADRPPQASSGQPGTTDGNALHKELELAQCVSLRCDFNLVFSNYTGSSPDHPDDEVQGGDSLGWDRSAIIF